MNITYRSAINGHTYYGETSIRELLDTADEAEKRADEAEAVLLDRIEERYGPRARRSKLPMREWLLWEIMDEWVDKYVDTDIDPRRAVEAVLRREGVLPNYTGGLAISLLEHIKGYCVPLHNGKTAMWLEWRSPLARVIVWRDHHFSQTDTSMRGSVTDYPESKRP